MQNPRLLPRFLFPFEKVLPGLVQEMSVQDQLQLPEQMA